MKTQGTMKSRVPWFLFFKLTSKRLSGSRFLDKVPLGRDSTVVELKESRHRKQKGEKRQKEEKKKEEAEENKSAPTLDTVRVAPSALQLWLLQRAMFPM